jgi:hypothetical protein
MDIENVVARYAEVDEQIKALEKEKAVLQAALREAGENTYYLSLSERKVAVSAGEAPTEINAAALGTYLIDHRRKSDFLNVCKVTVKDLSTLIDGDDLVKEFGFKGKVPNLKVSVLGFSKADLSVIAEKGTSALGNVIQG